MLEVEVPYLFQAELILDGEPLANCSYDIQYQGKSVENQKGEEFSTDQNGKIEENLLLNTNELHPEITVIVEEEGVEQSYLFQLDHPKAHQEQS